jgi:hypothetical protein
VSLIGPKLPLSSCLFQEGGVRPLRPGSSDINLQHASCRCADRSRSPLFVAENVSQKWGSKRLEKISRRPARSVRLTRSPSSICWTPATAKHIARIDADAARSHGVSKGRLNWPASFISRKSSVGPSRRYWRTTLRPPFEGSADANFNRHLSQRCPSLEARIVSPSPTRVTSVGVGD